MRNLVCFLVLVLTLACGGGDGGAPATVNDTPTLANIVFNPNQVPVNATGGSASVTLSVDYQAPGGNLSQLVLSEGGVTDKESISGVAGSKSGTISGTLPLDTTHAGTFTFQAYVTTSQGTASNSVTATFTVTPAAAVLTGLNPTSAVTGGPAMTLTVTGTGFSSNAQILWNGSPLNTVVLSSTTLSAEVPASDLAVAGTDQISVMSDGVLSSTFLQFVVGNGSAMVLSAPTNDLAWDPTRNVLYASLPSSAGANGNTIATVDPVSGLITSTVFAGNEPGRLALSDDGSFLYAGINGRNAIQRFSMPGLVADLLIPLGSSQDFGPNVAHDIQVMPGAPHTIAVSLACSGNSVYFAGLAIFDDATPRTSTIPGWMSGTYLMDSIQWSPDGAALYASNTEDNAFDFYILAVNASGVTVSKDQTDTFTNFNDTIRLDPGNHLLYSGSGQVLDPVTGMQQGTYPVSGPMTTDSTLGLAYFLDSTTEFSGKYTMRAYDLVHFTPQGTLDVKVNTLPTDSFANSPSRILRWGDQGLAMGGRGSSLYLLSGPFVQGH